jgi:hypothetical protein
MQRLEQEDVSSGHAANSGTPHTSGEAKSTGYAQFDWWGDESPPKWLTRRWATKLGTTEQVWEAWVWLQATMGLVGSVLLWVRSTPSPPFSRSILSHPTTSHSLFRSLPADNLPSPLAWHSARTPVTFCCPNVQL